jgi:hypothetical protein
MGTVAFGHEFSVDHHLFRKKVINHPEPDTYQRQMRLQRRPARNHPGALNLTMLQ